jgi:hypothetical protein
MKKRSGAAGISMVLAALFLAGLPVSAPADVNVNINIGAPVVVAEPAAVALIPGAGVYFVPGVEPDLFFFGGFWWSPRGDRWYRAGAYNGPWVVVKRRVVPVEVVRVPRDYRARYKKAKHVPYGQWKKQHEGRGHGKDRGKGRGRN